MNPIKTLPQAIFAGLIAIAIICAVQLWPFSLETPKPMQMPAEGTTVSFNYHADSLAMTRQHTHVDIMHVSGDSFRIHIAGITPSIIGVHLKSAEGEPFVFISQEFSKYYGEGDERYLMSTHAHEWLFLLSNERLEVFNYERGEKWKRSFQVGQ